MEENPKGNLLKNPLVVAYAAIGLLFLSLFSQPQTKDNSSEISLLEGKIEAHNKRIVKMELDTIFNDKSSTALQATTKDYSILESSAGNFLVSTDDISKYANGYKITLRIGNPNFITFTDVNATVEYGEAFDSKKDYQEWRNSLRTVNVTLDKPLLPATWNKFVVTVAPAKEDDLGYLRLKLDTNKVVLSHDYRP